MISGYLNEITDKTTYDTHQRRRRSDIRLVFQWVVYLHNWNLVWILTLNFTRNKIKIYDVKSKKVARVLPHPREAPRDRLREKGDIDDKPSTKKDYRQWEDSKPGRSHSSQSRVRISTGRPNLSLTAMRALGPE